MCDGKGYVGDDRTNARANSRMTGQGGAGARRRSSESEAVNEKKRPKEQPGA